MARSNAKRVEAEIAETGSESPAANETETQTIETSDVAAVVTELTADPVLAAPAEQLIAEPEFAAPSSAPAAETPPAADDKPKMLEVDSADVMVQPRTLRLPKPTLFYFEPASPRRKIDEGNDANQIEHGVHQVDPNRVVSCAPVMPNLALLRDSDNPYPIALDDTVVSSKRWDKFCKLSYAIWEILKSSGKAMTAAQIVEDAVALSGVGMSKDGKKITSDANYATIDTLRDLRCYGLVASEDAGKFFKKTAFRIVDDPKAVPFRERPARS